MSRDRIYIYVDGVMTPAWQDNGPGYARTSGYGGSLVVGPSGNKREDMERRAENERLRKAAKVEAQRQRRHAARDAAA